MEKRDANLIENETVGDPDRVITKGRKSNREKSILSKTKKPGKRQADKEDDVSSLEEKLKGKPKKNK